VLFLPMLRVVLRPKIEPLSYRFATLLVDILPSMVVNQLFSLEKFPRVFVALIFVPDCRDCAKKPILVLCNNYSVLMESLSFRITHALQKCEKNAFRDAVSTPFSLCGIYLSSLYW
jgi:hypothetical protein